MNKIKTCSFNVTYLDNGSYVKSRSRRPVGILKELKTLKPNFKNGRFTDLEILGPDLGFCVKTKNDFQIEIKKEANQWNTILKTQMN